MTPEKRKNDAARTTVENLFAALPGVKTSLQRFNTWLYFRLRLFIGTVAWILLFLTSVIVVIDGTASSASNPMLTGSSMLLIVLALGLVTRMHTKFYRYWDKPTYATARAKDFQIATLVIVYLGASSAFNVTSSPSDSVLWLFCLINGAILFVWWCEVV